jgi:hypothetical protein
MRKYFGAFVWISFSLLGGCAAPVSRPNSGLQNPFPPVPAPMQEAIPKPPVSAEPLVWQPGHWNWNGSSYSWQPGEYVPAAGHGALFQPGYWAQTPRGWVWEPAHWTS